MSRDFNHGVAFGRNIGWVTEGELQRLRTKRVAIAGLGGVGGRHLMTLTRLGLGGFHISDPDSFELANFNRQAGATLRNLGRPKIDVLEAMALDVNPELKMRRFPGGVSTSDVDRFLEGVDLYVDGLDFFVMDIREAVFAACARKGIPAITAAPLGWGVSMLVFLPGGTTFEEYFQMEGRSELEKLQRFLVGLSPSGTQFGALVDPTRLDISNQRGPSTPVGCELCAAVASATAVKILLRRGALVSVPDSLHIDMFSNRFSVLSRPGGMSHPLMRRQLSRMRKEPSA